MRVLRSASHNVYWLIYTQNTAKDGGFQSSNPCSRVKGPQFSQESDYEALSLEVEDTFALLSELQQPEYEISLLVATCGLRSSEALGLKWCDILWERAMVSIRQTFVHGNIQDGAKTKLSRSRVEVPQLALDVLASWRTETMYAAHNDFVFPVHEAMRTEASQWNDCWFRTTSNQQPYGRASSLSAMASSTDGHEVSRFLFHNLGRHSLASFLMDEQENPAVVQAILRHAQLDMTLYYSHSSRKAKRAAVENYAQHLAPGALRVPVRVQQALQ